MVPVQERAEAHENETEHTKAERVLGSVIELYRERTHTLSHQHKHFPLQIDFFMHTIVRWRKHAHFPYLPHHYNRKRGWLFLPFLSPAPSASVFSFVWLSAD